MSLKIFAPAKVNITLHVSAPIPKGTKFAGYHRLDSLVMFVNNIGDNLYFSKNDTSRCNLKIEGMFAAGLKADIDNIIIKAHRLLADYCGRDLGVDILLDKNLPIASGIGGGSTDAAATLLGINELYGLGLPPSKLAQIAINLGADVPVCVNQQAIIMRGIGNEFLDAPKLIDIDVIIANPLVAVSTPAVYHKFDEFGGGSNPDFLEFSYSDCANLHDFLDIMVKTKNDLEPACFAKFPAVEKLKTEMSKLTNVKFVRMSGSGGSVFAVFENSRDAQNACKELMKAYNSNIWTHAGKLVYKNQ